MKRYYNEADDISDFATQANIWTLLNSEIEQVSKKAWISEIEKEATGNNGFSNAFLVGADDDDITISNPEYKGFMSEGDAIVLLATHSSIANQNKLISAIQAELEDFEYFLFDTGVSGADRYSTLCKGISNVTQTQFYEPALQTNADVDVLGIYDDE